MASVPGVIIGKARHGNRMPISGIAARESRLLGTVVEKGDGYRNLLIYSELTGICHSDCNYLARAGLQNRSIERALGRVRLIDRPKYSPRPFLHLGHFRRQTVGCAPAASAFASRPARRRAATGPAPAPATIPRRRHPLPHPDRPGAERQPARFRHRRPQRLGAAAGPDSRAEADAAHAATATRPGARRPEARAGPRHPRRLGTRGGGLRVR